MRRWSPLRVRFRSTNRNTAFWLTVPGTSAQAIVLSPTIIGEKPSPARIVLSPGMLWRGRASTNGPSLLMTISSPGAASIPMASLIVAASSGTTMVLPTGPAQAGQVVSDKTPRSVENVHNLWNRDMVCITPPMVVLTQRYGEDPVSCASAGTLRWRMNPNPGDPHGRDGARGCLRRCGSQTEDRFCLDTPRDRAYFRTPFELRQDICGWENTEIEGRHPALESKDFTGPRFWRY